MEIIKALFWIATLYGCLQAAPTCRKGTLKVEEMKTNVTCEADSTFYTPQVVEAKCLPAAVDCVRRELLTAKQECKDPNNYIEQAIAYLERITKDHPLNSHDCPCEAWPSTNFNTFLKNLETLCEFVSS